MDTMDNPITPPLPSPSFAVPSLDTLPSDILLQIVSDSDESTLWAMRETCHALRDSTEKALKPFLEEKRVTVKPEFMVDAYNAIPPLSSADNTARQNQLRAITQKFTNHLASFPPSSTLLKRLVIELRDDAADAGWAQLAKLAPQLESAEIHIFDRFWQKQPIPANYPYPTLSHFILRDHLYPDLLFSLLTTLTVVGTARVMQHLGHIARSAPNLRGLTLGNHWSRREDAEPFYHMMPPLIVPIFPNLEHLKVAGYDSWLDQFLQGTCILLLSPRLHNFTIYRIRFEEDHYIGGDAPLRRLLETIGWHSRLLTGLAVYGLDALAFVGEMERAQRLRPDFHQLASLTVELSEADYISYDPLLLEPPRTRPSLPNLRRMTWVNRRTPEKASKRAYGAKLQGDEYDEAAISRLLDIFPSVSQARCLAEYPADPFAPIDLTLQAGGEVLCCVNRADNVAD